ncbi:hypothetical protein J3D43_003672 [Paenibacillus xylanexedens]|uniref:hypothetical protein n=1 Tax=Paenibacillus xylanexedens TaxID=528191 RepID=UPI0020A09AB1|nr:hypothetical protein [Paenibacillus xylanexedens]MCP1425156.1 hypothetical protein [Paenibacillus xylanexedens]
MPTLDNYSLSNYGLGGIPEKYATGEITGRTGTAAGTYFKPGGDPTQALSYVTVNYNFGFVPRIINIMIKNPADSNYSAITQYLKDYKNARNFSYCISRHGGGGYETEVYTSPTTGVFFYVNESGFRLHFGAGNPPYPLVWEAWG